MITQATGQDYKEGFYTGFYHSGFVARGSRGEAVDMARAAAMAMARAAAMAMARAAAMAKAA